MTAVFNHTYKKAPLWPMAVMLVQTVLKGSSHISESSECCGLQCSICELLYCAGEPVHFQPLFQEHLLCSIS